jgi:hypothetical protein
MATDNFCFYLQNRLIQTGQTGGQRYSDTSPFCIPWSNTLVFVTKNYDIDQRLKFRILALGQVL